jgi:hypothetical protein
MVLSPPSPEQIPEKFRAISIYLPRILGPHRERLLGFACTGASARAGAELAAAACAFFAPAFGTLTNVI